MKNYSLPKKFIAGFFLFCMIVQNYGCMKHQEIASTINEDQILLTTYSSISKNITITTMTYFLGQVSKGEKISRAHLSELTLPFISSYKKLKITPTALDSKEIKNFINNFSDFIYNKKNIDSDEFNKFALSELGKINDQSKKETAAFILEMTISLKDYIYSNKDIMSKIFNENSIGRYRNLNGQLEIIQTAAFPVIIAVTLAILGGIATGIGIATFVCGSSDPSAPNYNPAYENCVIVGGILGGILGGLGYFFPVKPITEGEV